MKERETSMKLRPQTKTKGELIVAGTGIMLAGQCTLEARNAIAGADIVPCVAGDKLVLQWLRELNPRLAPLDDLYLSSPDRPSAYRAMVENIVQPLASGAVVCAVFYGHPGVFVTPSHEAIAAARARGFPAQMLAGVSAEDCLFADLGVDPGNGGCASYEAHEFFMTARPIDPLAHLVLWQLAALGDTSFSRFQGERAALEALGAVLSEVYPSDHEIVIYEASVLPVRKPSIQRLRLRDIGAASITQASTLYAPPLAQASAHPERLRLLGAWREAQNL